MCMEDIRNARESQVRLSVLQQPTNGTYIIPANTRRVGMFFIYNSTVGPLLFASDVQSPSTTAYLQYNFQAGNQSIFRVEQWGQWLTGELFLFEPSASGTIVTLAEICINKE